MILAVSVMILLGMQVFWNRDYKGPGGLLAAVEQKLQTVMNGGQETTGPDSGDGESDGSGGDGGDGGGGDGDGDGGDDGGGGGGGGDGDGPVTKDPPDDGHLDPLWPDFPGTVAKALAENVVERRKLALQGGVDAAGKALAKAAEVSQAAAKEVSEALQDPALSPLRRLELENAAAAARIEHRNAEILLENVKAEQGFHRQMLDRFSKAVGLLSVSGKLLDADRERQALIREGRYEEAWRKSTGAAVAAVVGVATSLTDRLPGVGGVLVSETLEAGAEVAGQRLGDASFTGLVDISHWLYERSWWPKEIRPRFPRGYRPSPP
jgi:hypothetical protein